MLEIECSSLDADVDVDDAEEVAEKEMEVELDRWKSVCLGRWGRVR